MTFLVDKDVCEEKDLEKWNCRICLVIGRPRGREARRFVRDPRAYFLDFFPWGEFDGLIKSDKTFEERVTGNYLLNFLS